MILSLVQLVVGIAIVQGPCPGVLPANSCYEPATRTIYIAPFQRDADNLMHEYGHAWDFLRLTDTDRARFQRIMGYPRSLDWWQEPRYRLAPGEEFANAYADCALGTKRKRPILCRLLPRSARAVWRTFA